MVSYVIRQSSWSDLLFFLIRAMIPYRLSIASIERAKADCLRYHHLCVHRRRVEKGSGDNAVRHFRRERFGTVKFSEKL